MAMRRLHILSFFMLVVMAASSASAQSDVFGVPVYGLEAQGEAPPQPQPTPSQSEGNLAPDAGHAPQQKDYERNASSDVFGANLFTGAFAQQATVTFNDDYAINIGDTVNVRLWGAYNYQAALRLDAQGNIFLPNVGPVNLLGARNRDLQTRIEQAVYSVFKSNVQIYASLAAAQPVRVFVGGFVNRPGAYSGTSLDSVLHYLDQAGGIDTERGSFLDVVVKRGTATRARINLYNFLLSGEMPQIQLADGDVIFVNARNHVLKVQGLAENPRVFEFSGDRISLEQVIRYARPSSEATHVRVTRSAGTVRNVEYYPLEQASAVTLLDGDSVDFTADKKPGTITVRVEGEHESSQEFVLPYGSRLRDVMEQIAYSERSAPENLQLFRKSVQIRQREALDASLHQLEVSALTGRSGTADEARLRKDEADLLLRFVERARKVEPKGQVVIARAAGRDDLLLEHSDVIHIPARDRLVVISGYVLFPQASVYDRSMRVSDYIDRAGGFAGKKKATRIIIAHPDGTYAETDGSSRTDVKPGDQIMVMPNVDTKNRQIFKEVTQVLYQIAVSAGVVLGI